MRYSNMLIYYLKLLKYKNVIVTLRIHSERCNSYTGSVVDTDRRNICVKNLKPVVPPGTSATIIKNNVTICTTANIMVKIVLCIIIAK